jgi:hypothetical protein
MPNGGATGGSVMLAQTPFDKLEPDHAQRRHTQRC